MTKAKRPTYAELAALVRELRGETPQALTFAYDKLAKLTRDNYMGSGLVVSITSLKGAEIIAPFVCADGFTPETIKALQGQVLYTHELHQMYGGKLSALAKPATPKQ